MSNNFPEKSYAPYSQNPKTCVVESSTGKFYAGIRIENISYPLTIPAIQAACTICLSEGETPSKLYLSDYKYEQLSFWKNEFDLEIIIEQDLPLNKAEDLLKSISGQLDASEKLKQLLPKAVVPNSDFQVAAILFTKTGYFEGVNVEVSEWSKGLCAERVVLSKALSAGFRNLQRLEIHTKKGQISSPCGACRQVIVEFLPYHDIILHHADGTISEHLSADLLPFNFKSSSLTRE
ncbi:cytidine deaminase [Gracilimonas sp. Q87]|uniref:cytidine deaminase n=1 Tax=Gracilimonas sp. Q87 TaxID=3384766 RepID=UPI003983F9F3